MRSEKLKVTKRTKESLIVTYAKTRIKNNKNWLAAITGPTGSGKTYSGLALAELIDTDFNSDSIVFRPEEFIQLLNSGTLKKGSVILFDEAGVTLNAQQWHQSSNQMIQHVLQTFRHKNYIVIFTAPDFGFIDKASRKLMHCYMETQRIDFTNKRCILKPFMIQSAQRSGKLYFKYLRVILPIVGTTTVTELSLGLPSKTIIDEYEKKKTAFTTFQMEKAEEKLLSSKKDEKKERLSEEEIKFNTIKRLRNINKIDNTKHQWEDIGDMYQMEGNAIRMWYSKRDRSINRGAVRV